MDETGHFCHRDEYEAVFNPPKGDVPLERIFSYAESSAQNERSSKLRKRVANRVLVVGQAGIGKTVLTKMFTLMVLQGVVLPGCEFLFYIRFRDIDFDEKRTLLEIMLSSCGCGWSHSKEADARLWSALKSNPNVLIVLDGLDEAKGKEMLHQPSRCNPFTQNKVSTQLKSLLSGESLPDAKLLVTSRPRDGNGLHGDHKPRTVLQVVGLDEDARKQLGRDICVEKWMEVDAFLGDHPHVEAICYVPVFCVLIMKILRMNLSCSGNITLNALTKILVVALGNYANSECMREDQDDLRSLALLAFNGFKNRSYMFDEGDLSRAKISDRGCQSFLSTWGSSGRVRILNVGKKSFFSHLVWQELFTSIHILFFATEEEFERNLKRLHRRRWEVVARCLFGICNSQVLPELCDVLGVEQGTPVLSKRKKQLHNLALGSLEDVSNNLVNNDKKVEKLLRVCNWFFELGDTTGVAKLLPEKVALRGTIYPSDATSLMFCFKESFRQVELNIRYPTQFVGNAMAILFKELQGSLVTVSLNGVLI